MAPVYGWIVDTTGTYLTPNLICLGLSAFTLSVLYLTTRETYGGALARERSDSVK